MADPFESWRSSGDTTLSNLLGPRPTASKGLPMDFSFSDILKSASDLLGSQPGSTPYEFGGKVTDKTGSPELGYLANLLALNSGGTPGTGQAGIAFHGSPHSFEKFSLSKIGTGEGAQAYGHGLYFAENPNVAKSYANPGDFTGLDSANFPKRAGGVYKVDIPDEHIAKMLDWDKGLSEQPKVVQDAVKKIYPKEYANMLKQESLDREIKGVADSYKQEGNKSYIEAIRNAPPEVQAAWHKKVQEYQTLTKNYEFALPSSGEAIHRNLEGRLGANENVASFLKANGIPGIKYLDQGSRAGGKGTRNFVIFDENIPKIVGKE